MSANQTTVEMRVVGNPLAKNKKRARWVDGKPKVYPDQRDRPWTVLVIDEAKRAGLAGKRLTQAIDMTVVWIFPRPKSHYGTGKNEGTVKGSSPQFHIKKPDVDNLAKAVMDAFTEAGVWSDDSVVDRCYLNKVYCIEGQAPGCTIILKWYPERAALGGGGSDGQ